MRSDNTYSYLFSFASQDDGGVAIHNVDCSFTPHRHCEVKHFLSNQCSYWNIFSVMNNIIGNVLKSH